MSKHKKKGCISWSNWNNLPPFWGDHVEQGGCYEELKFQMLLARTLNFGLFNAEVEVEVFFFICFKWSKGISVWITTRIVFNLVRKMYFLKFWKQLTFFAWSADKSFLLIFKFKPCANFDCFAKKQRLSSNFRFDSPHNCTITNMVLMMARYENNDFSGPLIRSM